MSEDAPIYHRTLLQHGESTGNAEGRWLGQLDCPPTDSGRLQVGALARRWQSEQVDFDSLIASPLRRVLDINGHWRRENLAVLPVQEG